MTNPIRQLTLSAVVLSMAVPAFSLLGQHGFLGGGASAQTATSPRVVSPPDCPANKSVAEPATHPDASKDATAAENSGTTGWSGGTGGSHLGTNTQGAVATSKTWQPPTARGLDLKGPADSIAVC